MILNVRVSNKKIEMKKYKILFKVEKIANSVNFEFLIFLYFLLIIQSIQYLLIHHKNMIL